MRGGGSLDVIRMRTVDRYNLQKPSNGKVKKTIELGNWNGQNLHTFTGKKAKKTENRLVVAHVV